MSKMMIDIEIKETEVDAILVYNAKTKKFETRSISKMFKKELDEIEAKLKELDKMTTTSSNQYKHELGRMRGLIDKISNVLGGKGV